MSHKMVSKVIGSLAFAGAFALSNVTFAETSPAEEAPSAAQGENPGILSGSCFIYIDGQLVQGVQEDTLQDCINYANIVSAQYGVPVNYQFCSPGNPCTFARAGENPSDSDK